MASKTISVIDHGTGNLFSVARALEKLGASAKFINTPKQVEQAESIILPGVGAFADGMLALEKLDLIDSIVKASKNKPVMGICLGMQMLFDQSEEMGSTKGIGLISGKVMRIPDQGDTGVSVKIPHIGWNGLHHCHDSNKWQSSILDGVQEGESVYFVHSYVAIVKDVNDCIATTNYGGNNLAIAVSREFVSGCQFHPERSGPTGLRILSNFIGQ